jgi:hypothetical protein
MAEDQVYPWELSPEARMKRMAGPEPGPWELTPEARMKAVGGSAAPSGTTASPSQGGGFLDRLKSRAQDYPREIAKENVAGREEMSQGWQDIKGGHWLKGGLEAGMGALRYGYSPIQGAVHATVGLPIERMGYPKTGEYADFATNLILPGPKAITAGSKAAEASGITKVLAPETRGVMADRAAESIRKQTGLSALQTERTVAQKLSPHEPVSLNMTPTEHRELIDTLQSGRDISKLPEHQQDYARAIQSVYKDGEARLKKELPSKGAQMRFKENYVNNIWKVTPGGYSKTAGDIASGASGMHGGQVYTLREGIERGGIPITTNPTQLAAIYEKSLNRFIATEKVWDQAKRDNIIHMYSAKDKIPQGMVPVMSKSGRDVGAGAKAYADEGWATVWNNYVSKGLDETQLGPTYRGLQKAENALVMFKLGLSGYHAMMSAKEAIAGQISKGIGELATPGKRIEGFKSLAGAPIAPWSVAATGNEIRRVAEGLSPAASERVSKIIQLQAEAGGRFAGGRQAAGMNELLSSRKGAYNLGAFTTRARQAFGAFTGTNEKWAREYGETANRAIKDPLGTSMSSAKKLISQTGRILDTVSYPLFEKYIPSVKNGSFYRQMGSWLDANPYASEREQLRAARKIWDSVDNRIGEMVKDNLFMPNTFKQALQLATVSYSYEMGTIREFGGGLLDLYKGGKLSVGSPNWSPKMGYVLSTAITDGTINATIQKSMSGMNPGAPSQIDGKPGNALMDLIAPRTGGIVQRYDSKGRAYPEEERIGPIGYMKDLYHSLTDPVGWAAGKKGPLVNLISEGITGRQSFDNARFAPPKRPEQSLFDAAPEWMTATLGHVAEAFEPISAGNIREQPEGSRIAPWAGALGFHGAGMSYTNPEKLEEIEYKRAKGEWAAHEKAQLRARAKAGDKQALDELRRGKRYEEPHYGGP